MNKCKNHFLFAAIIVISADPLISKWLKQSRARFPVGNRIGAMGLAGGNWREKGNLKIIINISTNILSRNNGVEFLRILNLDKRTVEYIQGLHEVMAQNNLPLPIASKIKKHAGLQ